MKARTQFQKLVVSLSGRVKPITEKQKQYGFDHVFEKRGILRKHIAGCLECGHSWKLTESTLSASLLGCTCPSCGHDLKMEVTPKRVHSEKDYYAIVSVIGGVQVVRNFLMSRNCKIGTPAVYGCIEVMQHWVDEKLNFETVGLNVNTLSYVVDQWIYGSGFELRGSVSERARIRNSIIPAAIYPRMRVLDCFKRNGFAGSFHEYSPVNFIQLIMCDPKAETLLKTGQIDLFNVISQYRKGRTIEKYWSSVKICIRNNYTISDATIWLDYLDMLDNFKKDLCNSFYVCPVDLKASHDLLMNRRKKQREAEERIRRLARERWEAEAPARAIEEAKWKKLKGEELEQEYANQKGVFFGVMISDGNYSIEAFKSVKQFEEEGELLKHCIYENAYYKKAKSLLLSARVDGVPVETIEISLEDFRVVQARGAHNLPTPHHQQILKLVQRNIHEFSKIRHIG